MIVAPMLATAALTTGCAATDDLMTNVELPASGTSQPADGQAQQPPIGPGLSAAEPGKLVINGQERAYLDVLSAAGVRPSSELLALSIGSYVCQARAAHQSQQAIWDYVYPLVRSDLRDAHLGTMAPGDGDEQAVRDATNTYIQTATERLC